ncbi:hypothetical protein [Sphingobacterium sp. LRF_L2]|uniref:hypothetical protein n=1 Tax=Sphingobacterium sp. LRF_L2 TaxID=3369421 RepID=UPI003F646402
MKIRLLTLLLFGYIGIACGQGSFNLSFVKDSIVASKSKDSEVIVAIPFSYYIAKGDTSTKKFSLSFLVKESSLPNSDYSMDLRPRLFSSLQENETLYVRLKKDILTDRERRLELQINAKNGDKEINDNNLGSKRNFVLIVKPSVDVSEDYTLLSYLGTNFDMADGKTKAKNLFFATNVFVPPIEGKNKFGFYLSLYGNRTMSNIDTAKYSNRAIRVQRVNDSLYFRERASGSVTISTVSDNIGAYFSPLLKLSRRSSHHFNLYYSPSVEFVWRRINRQTVYGTPTLLDTLESQGSIPSSFELSTLQGGTIQQSEFDLKIGAASVFLVYETKAVSVRATSSIGFLTTFSPSRSSRSNTSLTGDLYPPMTKKYDAFYTGKVWITEPVTGITLQAEIANQLKSPRPFYGVTLSKAFKIKDIGSVLSPLVNK